MYSLSKPHFTMEETVLSCQETHKNSHLKPTIYNKYIISTNYLSPFNTFTQVSLLLIVTPFRGFFSPPIYPSFKHFMFKLLLNVFLHPRHRLIDILCW